MNKKRGIWLVLLLSLLLFLGSGKGVIEGCYYYADSNLYCTVVSEEEAAADYPGYGDYFSPGRECGEIELCQTVICSTDCEEKSKGECGEQGGQEVTEEVYNEWCSSGCCKVGAFCDYVSRKGECLKKARQQGRETFELWDITAGVDRCLTNLCQREITLATLKGKVWDEETGELIQGAEVEIEGEKKITGEEGAYQFRLIPATYLVKAKARGYLVESESISLGMNGTVEFDFRLVKAEGQAEISGRVEDKTTNLRLEGATVTWKGATEGFVLTDRAGLYKIEGLALGEYTLRVSKYGYATKEEKIVLGSEVTRKDFELEGAALQGIKGKVWLDRDNDGERDEEIYGASIYIDGVFRGYSQYEPLGKYEVALEAGEHELSASYLEFGLKDKFKFPLGEGEGINKDLVLTKYVGECSVDGENPAKEVEEFSAKHVLGEKKVLLEWKKPCPEVSGYELYRGGEFLRSFSPADFSYVDEEVEWGENYNYELAAVYTDTELRYSEKTGAAITLGDEGCEGRYHQETGWELFCLVGKEERKIIWTCDEENKKIVSKNCGELDGPGQAYFCGAAGEINAECKDTGGCGWYSQGADPFGLYYERQRCYGVSEPLEERPINYCYFDYTKTIVDKCGSCTEIRSCFDYQSEEACKVNNCLGRECQWIAGAANEGLINYNLILPGLVTPETGHGYCGEKDYKKEDKCILCGPEAELFENYYCTAEICGGLGNCFSTAELKSCESCGEKPTPRNNCYAYSTEVECTRSQPLTNLFGEIILSKDKCGWGRCVWQGIAGGAGKCVKDGDGNDREDCEHLAAGQVNCKIDNQAPTTKLVPEGVKVVSLAYPTLTFRGIDKESKMGVLGYCLASANPRAAKCNRFERVNYEGKLGAEELIINLINGSLKGEIVKGETYRLRYYSKDEYSNQESIKESFVFVDTELPSFEIGEEIKIVADTTDLTVFLNGLNEQMKCGFGLKQILPLGGTETKLAGREEKDKKVSFENLKGIIYELTVSCEDDYGNVGNKTKPYLFDLEQGIEIVYPKGVIGEMGVAFELKTLVGARCELYEVVTGGKIADFRSGEEGKEHKTEPVSGFIEGSYRGKYKAVCIELLSQRTLEEYFNFEVDFSGPGTKITLQEKGYIEIIPSKTAEGTSNFGWKKSFVEAAEVRLECEEEEQGFPCQKSYYCLTEKEYEPKNAPCYKEFSKSFGANGSIRICYYSEDIGNNRGAVICGDISIEGYGILLVKPKAYWYEKEIWGVSNQPVFEWELRTKVPTQECKFDWVRGSDYEKIPEQRKLGKEGESYKIMRFPEGVAGAPSYGEEGGVQVVYVRCKDLGGEVGPVQKINLEYDPTAPRIEEAGAEPNPVYEGRETTIKVKTDDKSLCRYSDNSGGEGSSEYELMGYKFPGEEEDILEMLHKELFEISFSGERKTYNLRTQCKNGAEDLSEVKEFNFLVDYSVEGNIISLEPSGEMASPDVTLRVLTNKNSQCTYDGRVFEVTGGTEHSQGLKGLKEGEYIYLINCLVGGEARTGQIKFKIDLTPPRIERIEDGNLSCELNETPDVYVYTNEDNLSGYYYELYEKGNKSGTGKLVSNGSIGAEIPFRVKVSMIENNSYYFKIMAGDKVGNWGGFKESDGFLAVGGENRRCLEDKEAPKVSFVVNESCTKTAVEMSCEDETACTNFSYGKSLVSNLCNKSQGYTGQKILFEKTGWLCYQVGDVRGNKASGEKKIEFKDGDGDGIGDSCDNCSGTKAGAAVNAAGCASGEISEEEKKEDTDKDGLPDYWEKQYDAVGCKLDYMDEDSDGDGFYDSDEDYDKDGYDNYDEYKVGFDPCVAEAPREEPVRPTEPVEPKKKIEPEEEEIGEEEEINWVAWILFILGWLMVLGGGGYLFYYYKSVKPAASQLRAPGGRKEVRREEKPGFSLKERLLGLRRGEAEREKAKRRAEVFREFTKKSREIPHIESILGKGGSPLRRLGELSGTYTEKKEQIKPGLRPEEKSVFARLENISKQTKEKEIGKVVSEGEAKNIFDKLKEISKKRKEEGK